MNRPFFISKPNQWRDIITEDRLEKIVEVGDRWSAIAAWLVMIAALFTIIVPSVSHIIMG